jgi:hypothetical protein
MHEIAQFFMHFLEEGISVRLRTRPAKRLRRLNVDLVIIAVIELTVKTIYALFCNFCNCKGATPVRPEYSPKLAQFR